MQILVPHYAFDDCVNTLHARDLQPQLNGILAVIEALHTPDEETPFGNHPLVRMWRGHEPQMLTYGLKLLERCTEVDQGIPMQVFTNKANLETLEWALQVETSGEFSMELPPWWGNEAIHAGHLSELIRQRPTHYGNLFPQHPDVLPVIWPVG